MYSIKKKHDVKFESLKNVSLNHDSQSIFLKPPAAHVSHYGSWMETKQPSEAAVVINNMQ